MYSSPEKTTTSLLASQNIERMEGWDQLGWEFFKLIDSAGAVSNVLLTKIVTELLDVQVIIGRYFDNPCLRNCFLEKPQARMFMSSKVNIFKFVSSKINNFE